MQPCCQPALCNDIIVRPREERMDKGSAGTGQRRVKTVSLGGKDIVHSLLEAKGQIGRVEPPPAVLLCSGLWVGSLWFGIYKKK